MLARGRKQFHGVKAEAGTHVVLQQPELCHGAHHVGLLQDADTIDRPIRVLLDDGDVKALLPQRDGCGETANTAADHQHRCRIHMPSAAGVAVL